MAIIDLAIQYPILSPRERQVCAKLVRELKNKEIGRELGISYRTVEDHRLSAIRKLGVRSSQLAFKLLGEPDIVA